MSDKDTLNVGKKLVELCKKGKNLEAVNTLYAPNVVSVETHSMPNMPARMEGIDARVYYPRPVHAEPAFHERALLGGNLTETARACAEVLSLPVHPGLNDTDLARIVGGRHRARSGPGLHPARSSPARPAAGRPRLGRAYRRRCRRAPAAGQARHAAARPAHRGGAPPLRAVDPDVGQLDERRAQVTGDLGRAVGRARGRPRRAGPMATGTMVGPGGGRRRIA